MKKLRTFLLPFIFIFGLLFHSCEEPPPPVPDCEKYGYGDVTIKNGTGFSLWVDCTYTSNGINYEKKLYSGGYYTYEMDKGTVYIWASFDGNDWVYDTHYLSACEDLTYTWYLDKKKSTGAELYLVVTKDGEIVKEITGFKHGLKE